MAGLVVLAAGCSVPDSEPDRILTTPAEQPAPVSSREDAPVPFVGGGAPIGRNREDPESYELALWVQLRYPGQSTTRLLVPSDYRTAASKQGPQTSVRDLYRALNETATWTASGLRVINPVGFVARLRQ